MTLKHTPGPWKKIADYVQAPRRGGAQHDIDICQVFTAETRAGEPAANARLIAAAPEMLDLLISAYRSLRGAPTRNMTNRGWVQWLEEAEKVLKPIAGDIP